ncbi:hypothetical protein [Alkalihalobacillus sp. BA299]|uniref:hypothetical protein n=1 Tax=Alkalihalobacillus sp. BA299 TaxID=2815938 RepID=UPI001ADD4265|nr:hypothetical protein [Alkalihalobacillus sp. BA299]
MRKYIFFCMFSLLLSACSNDEIVKEANNLKQKKENQIEEQESQEKKKKEVYEELAKPVEETLKETEKDKRSLITNDFEIKEEYTDENEFASFVAKQLFKFYNLELSPKDYYQFLIKYGSSNMKKELEVLENEEEGVVFLTNIQGLIKDRQLSGSDYEVTEVKLNSGKSEGFFYRKVISHGNSDYYITTIIMEDGVWKYQEDSPAPPFDEVKTN